MNAEKTMIKILWQESNVSVNGSVMYQLMYNMTLAVS